LLFIETEHKMHDTEIKTNKKKLGNVQMTASDATCDPVQTVMSRDVFSLHDKQIATGASVYR
jgi:hypothetical protein